MINLNIQDMLVEDIGFNPQDFQSVYLVKKLFVKTYTSKQNFTIKRINELKTDKDDEMDFINELKQDPELRSRINL